MHACLCSASCPLLHSSGSKPGESTTHFYPGFTHISEHNQDNLPQTRPQDHLLYPRRPPHMPTGHLALPNPLLMLISQGSLDCVKLNPHKVLEYKSSSCTRHLKILLHHWTLETSTSGDSESLEPKPFPCTHPGMAEFNFEKIPRVRESV